MTNDKFREAIEFHFDDLDVRDKEHLRALMRKRRFFNAQRGKDESEDRYQDRREKQEQRLLDDAWKHLKSVQKHPMMTARGRQEGINMEDVGRKPLMMRDKKTGRIIGWMKR